MERHRLQPEEKEALKNVAKIMLAAIPIALALGYSTRNQERVDSQWTTQIY